MSAHLNPEKKLAEMARRKPPSWNAVSPKTIMMTPRVMVRIIRMSFMEGDSRRKRNAKMRTKIRTEDLHIV